MDAGGGCPSIPGYVNLSPLITTVYLEDSFIAILTADFKIIKNFMRLDKKNSQANRIVKNRSVNKMPKNEESNCKNECENQIKPKQL